MTRESRRKFIVTVFSILGIGGLLVWFSKTNIIRWLLLRTSNEGLAITLAPNASEGICILTSSQTEGPFFISAPIRNNLVEDRQGLAMNLKIQIVRAPDCSPIKGAIVEIWHCDAEGVYSGYPEDLAHDPWKTLALAGTGGDNVQPLTESRFLRGAQESDAEGMVAFKTIFPGWYDGRAPHIHFKVLVDKKEQLTSQFYFEPGLCNQIYLNTAPYDKYGESPFTIHNDIVINEDINAVAGLLLNPTLSQTGMAQAAVKIGIEKSIS